MKDLIGLMGRKGSGKSTVASYLQSEFGFVAFPFAEPLKTMLSTLGLTDEMLYGAEKETPINWLYGKTPRYLMQTLGTEWGRNLVHPDIWTSIAHGRIANCLALGGQVVVEDVRFPNEIKAIHSLGGEIWGIERNDSYVSDAHISEALEISSNANWMIYNNSTFEDLRAAINTMMRPSR